MPVDTLDVLLCVLISFVAAAIHGVIGFGFNFLGAPILMLLYPQLIPAPIVINSIVLVLLVAWKSRDHIEWQALGWAVGACALGAFLAGFAIALATGRIYNGLFGTLLLLAVLVSLLGWQPRVNPSNAIVAGTLSGFMGTITSIGGPPIALLYQRVPSERLRGTLSAYFLLTSPFILIALWGADRLNWAEIKLSFVLLPGLLMGFACSRYLVGILDQRTTRVAVLVISAFGGIILLARLF